MTRLTRTLLWVVASVLVTGSSVLPILYLSPPPHAQEASSLRLTNGTWSDLYSTFSPDGRSVAFASNRTGAFAIWVMGSDGRHEHRLTFMPGDQSHPAFSPDGTRIAFLVDSSGLASLWMIEVDDGVLNRLSNLNESVGSFQWSPDGSRIAYDSFQGGRWGIRVVNSANGQETLLTSKDANSRYPAWSPDGMRIFLSSDRAGTYNIWSVGTTGQELVRLTFGPGNDSRPSVSPSGKSVAFVSNRGGSLTMWVMGTDGSNLREAESDPPTQDLGVEWVPEVAQDSFLTWNPQSQGVMFFTDRTYEGGSTNANVFVYYQNVTVLEYILGGAPGQKRVIGDSMIPVLFGMYDQILPAWGPNGTEIVYSSNISGHFNLWVKILASAAPKSPYSG